MPRPAPRAYSKDLRWRAIWIKEILGYQIDVVVARCFEDVKSGVSSWLLWVPFSCTRKHQWTVFSSCVNLLRNLSSDEGNTNENVTWKYNLIKFVLLISITLTCSTSTEMLNYPVLKLVGVALKFRKLNEKFAVVCSRSQQNLEFDVLQRTRKKCNKI